MDRGDEVIDPEALPEIDQLLGNFDRLDFSGVRDIVFRTPRMQVRFSCTQGRMDTMTIEPMLTEEMPASALVARVLQEAGIEMVFGISGGHTGRIVSGLSQYQNSIRTVLVREESLGGVMAEIYGRLTRRPGVLLGQGPWVLGNGLLGTIEAYLSSSPMLLLTDFSDAPRFTLHAPYQQATGDWGSWDARRAFSGVTKHVMQAHDPIAAVQATQLAIKHALAGQPGPVAVLYSHDSLAGSVAPDSQPALYPTRHYLPTPPPPAEPRLVEAAATALLSAQKPVLIAGNGVRIAQAYDHLSRLAEVAGIPVATTAAGKGCFAETHSLALGVFGTFGTAAANACVSEADLVIVVGSKLSPSDTAWENRALLDPTRQTFVQIDIEPRNASWNYSAEHVLIGDAAIVLDQLYQAVGSRGEARRQQAEQRVAAHRERHGYFNDRAYFADDQPILPQRVIGELQRGLPGIPAALGAKLVHPDRPVVAVCGDGGFAMTMNGLMTALEQDIPIVTVVFNNKALGWVLHGSGPFAAEFNDFNHAEIARAMGCRGVRITDPAGFGPALQEALAARTPTVIDVMTSLKVTFADITSQLAKDASPRRR